MEHLFTVLSRGTPQASKYVLHFASLQGPTAPSALTTALVIRVGRPALTAKSASAPSSETECFRDRCRVGLVYFMFLVELDPNPTSLLLILPLTTLSMRDFCPGNRAASFGIMFDRSTLIPTFLSICTDPGSLPCYGPVRTQAVIQSSVLRD